MTIVLRSCADVLLTWLVAVPAPPVWAQSFTSAQRTEIERIVKEKDYGTARKPGPGSKLLRSNSS